MSDKRPIPTDKKPMSTRRALDAVDGKRARYPDVDQPLTKSQKPSKLNLKHLPWKEIETLYCAGVGALELAAQYPPATKMAIEKRASREDWLTPAKLRAKAKKLIAKSELLAQDLPSDLQEVDDDPAAALALAIARGQIDHRRSILEEVGKSMKKLKHTDGLKIETIQDLAKADEIARRTLNLDAVEEQGKFIINMNAYATAPEVIDV